MTETDQAAGASPEQRWRLLLGADAPEATTRLDAEQSGMDAALAAL